MPVKDSPIVVRTKNDLASLNPADGETVHTLGYAAEGVGAAKYAYHRTGRSGAASLGYVNHAGSLADDWFELLHGGRMDLTQAGVVPNNSGAAAANLTAFNAATGSTAKHFVLPGDTDATTYFFFNPGLTLPAGKTLESYSSTHVRMRPAAQTTAGQIFLTWASDCVIRNIEFQGIPASGSQSLGVGITNAYGASRWRLEKVRSIQWGIGIQLDNTWIGTLDDCVAQTCSEAALKGVGEEINHVNLDGGEYATSPSCIKLTTGCNSFRVAASVEGATDLGRGFTVDTDDETIELVGHGFMDGDKVTFTATGTSPALPSPLDAGTTYYVVNATSADFQVSLTEGGAAVNLTTAGSGTLKVFGPAYGIHLTGSAIYNGFVCEGSYFETNKTHHVYADANCVLMGGSIDNNGFYASTADQAVKIARWDGTSLGPGNVYRYTPTNATEHVYLGPLCINGVVAPQSRGNQVLGELAEVVDDGANHHLFAPTKPQTLAYATPVAWGVQKGLSASLTLTGDSTLDKPTGLVAGQTLILKVKQGAGGSHSLTSYHADIDWGADGAPTLSTGEDEYDILTFVVSDEGGTLKLAAGFKGGFGA